MYNYVVPNKLQQFSEMLCPELPRVTLVELLWPQLLSGALRLFISIRLNFVGAI